MTWLLIIGMMAFAYKAPAQESRHLGRVQIEVTDSFGRTLNNWRVSSFVDWKGKEWKQNVQGSQITSLPYGRYSLRIESDSSLPFEANITVRQPVVTFIAGLLLVAFDDFPPSDEVRGRFGAHPGPESWCELTGIYTHIAYFANVQSDGTFVFPLIPSGSYMLVCRKGATTLHLSAFDVLSGSTPEINIGLVRAGF
jgi:hypothetical protein